ncbi:hypothetical protein [Streptomyces misionensis]|uniref:hypothetical protein n=1 Tax=Streptomyces misionensis TaxID=67331 RepID=UPI0033D69A15
MTTITFGDGRALDVPADIATAVYDALAGERAVAAPAETDFAALVELIARQSRVITHLNLAREVTIAAADATSPHSNRREIGIAAGMAPSVLGDVLERNGRPRNRRDGTVVYDWSLKSGAIDVEFGRVRAADDDQAAEFAVRDAKVRPVDADDETEETMNLVVRRRGRTTGPNSWIEYDATVITVLPA